jgi:nucleotide-binding universal stress UspA family protein
MFHSILAAVDGSAPSSAALAVAAGIARHQRAELTVLTVEPYGGGWGELPSEHLPGGVAARSGLEWGPPAPAILREADVAGHDLIVLGSRGRGALASTVLGSVARSVVSRSRVPVLVVKDTGGSPAAGFSRILVAVDGSPESHAALALAADLALTELAPLTLMTVIGVTRIVGMPESALVRLELDYAEYARDLLDAAQAMLPHGLSVDTRVGWGAVDAAILAEVERGGHDLVALGSRGRGMGRATLLGSTGLGMLRRCPVPVLIARPPARPASSPRRTIGGAIREVAAGRSPWRESAPGRGKTWE